MRRYPRASYLWLSADHGWVVAGYLRVGKPVARADRGVTVVALTTVRGFHSCGI